MKFLAEIKNRVLTIYDQEGYTQYLNTLDGRIQIDIRQIGNERTSQQNNYYHLYLRIIADETGEDIDSLHELFKKKFLSPTFKTVMGEEITIPPSTTKLTKKEFSDYITQIQALTQVPSPDMGLYLYN